MNLDAKSLAMSFGCVTAALWVACSLLVALMPGPMMSMTAHMFHSDMADSSWALTWPGFFLGLVAWAVWAAVAGWLVAWTYNRFVTTN